MKINTASKQREMQGSSLNVDYGFHMGAKAYHVLTDGMYSDIIPTIVRELSSNAYDSHVAAGKADEPFHVYCPTALDTDFAVKDNGIGLRYFEYSANIINEREGESTMFIKGDIRDDIEGISKIIVDSEDVIAIAPNGILFDHETKETVIRIPGNYVGSDIRVEFDDTIVLWTTYFASTKDDSDDFIGGWGLGSKTPNAYTDNYLVTNRYNGVKRTYNVSANEQGMPQINLFHHENTNESNGLEVRMAVEPSDYREFREAIKSQLRYFQPHPVVHNEDVKFPEIMHNGEYFMLLKDNLPEHGWRSASISVGNNAYSTDVESSLLSNTTNIVMKFKVGEVKVTASREELKYDDQVRLTIMEREREAIDEYRQFILDSIDMDDMTDYQKAEFLNDNSSALDLSEQRVKDAVGNSHYRYGANQITIPLGGWGDSIDFEYDEVKDDEGNVVGHKIRRYNCTHRPALGWFKYSPSSKKSNNCQPPHITPGKKYLVFLRDNRYSYVKKVNHWRHELDDSGNYYEDIYIVDCRNDEDFESLDNIKPLLNGNVTFVRISDIELPKSQSTSTYTRSSTPIARVLDFDKHMMHHIFHYPKMWEDDFTPLTHLDKEDAYVIKHIRGENQMTYEDIRFFVNYVNAGLPFDRTVKVYALPEAKYEKAIGYGFEPIDTLIAEMRKNVAIPAGYVNYKAVTESYHSNFYRSSVLELFTDDTIEKMDKDHPVRKAYRLRKITNWMKQRYHASFNAVSELVNTDDEELPEVSSHVQKVVEMSAGVCDNLYQSLVLLQDVSTWKYRDKQDAILEYSNWIFKQEK